MKGIAIIRSYLLSIIIVNIQIVGALNHHKEDPFQNFPALQSYFYNSDKEGWQPVSTDSDYYYQTPLEDRNFDYEDHNDVDYPLYITEDNLDSSDNQYVQFIYNKPDTAITNPLSTYIIKDSPVLKSSPRPPTTTTTTTTTTTKRPKKTFQRWSLPSSTSSYKPEVNDIVTATSGHKSYDYGGHWPYKTKTTTTTRTTTDSPMVYYHQPSSEYNHYYSDPYLENPHYQPSYSYNSHITNSVHNNKTTQRPYYQEELQPYSYDKTEDRLFENVIPKPTTDSNGFLEEDIDRQALALLGVPLGNFAFILGSVVVGSTAVTGLSYFDSVRRIDEKQEQIDALNTKVNKQQDEIDDLTSTVSKLSSSISTLESSLAALQATVNSQATEIASLRTDLTAAQTTITDQGTRLTTLEASVAALTTMVNALGNQAMEIMDLETRVNALETTTATLTTVPADLTALTARVVALEGAGAGANAAAITALTTRVDALETNVSTNLDPLPAQVTAVTTQSAATCAKVGEITDVTGTPGTDNDAILTSLLAITTNTC